MKKLKIEPYFWLVAAVGCLGISLWLSWQSYGFLKTAKPANGVIVTADFIRSGRSGHWNLLTRFQNAQGQPVTTMIWTQKGNVMMSDWLPGQSFPVLYDPANPQDARADGFKDFWMYPILLLAFSIYGFFTAFRTFRKVDHHPLTHREGHPHPLEESVEPETVGEAMKAGARSYWNLLNPILIIGFLLLIVLVILPFGYREIPRLLCPGAFLYLFPGEGLGCFIWPTFYFLFGFFAIFPFIFMVVNLVEICIPWAKRAFENIDAKHNPRWGFKGAMKDLWGLGKWSLWLIIPAIIGITRFYYLDDAGVHLFHAPFKTEAYPWDSIVSVQFSAKGEDEIKEGRPLVYHLLLKNGEDLEVSWDFGQDTTNDQLAEDYWLISKHLSPYPSVRVHAYVTEKGSALLQQLLGERANDLLLKR